MCNTLPDINDKDNVVTFTTVSFLPVYIFWHIVSTLCCGLAYFYYYHILMSLATTENKIKWESFFCSFELNFQHKCISN